ncbi:U5 small nuclear ribonucleoprotein TSSC4-like [Physella acuta]|uniref:U5 small nuclear ribonucleoprotein TSSC4-like n=1 Tax=Physella acuta TaxID=109671 RepID=UPI0027DD51EA|nr:U5 small nuclear ribonucleoprotein TSSC4-like [Physella acuta]XP_059150857.1 U5 small nuclear ribonucleoprotein TSSC4-like [Physella acuta]XP_059150858.1 U5 small nuclear ribonucleoprotein TSSC4-like [Physella acuta]XP_059150859.1 U5 small nuclear ribonucleoprotein TSSC4-like [Physella acuta]
MEPSDKTDLEMSSDFHLRSGTDLFTSRRNDVFASLQELENKHSAFLKAKATFNNEPELMKKDPEEEDDVGSMLQCKDKSMFLSKPKLGKTQSCDYEPVTGNKPEETKQQTDNCGRVNDATFRHPHHPPRKVSRRSDNVPDFKKNPEKYTHYSLRDVDDKLLSEKANANAAFSFLEERRLEKEKQASLSAGYTETDSAKYNVEETACSQGKMTFTRPRCKKMQIDNVDLKSNKPHSEASALIDEPLDEPHCEVDIKEVDEPFSEPMSDKNQSTDSAGNTFKPRKNVKRHIRHKESDDNSD